MKVMHLVLTPRFSGAEVLARDLCIYQQELGNEVAFASINPAEPDFLTQLDAMTQAGVAVSVPHKKPKRLQRLCIIRTAIRKFSPDIIFAHSVIPAAYSRIADITKRRVVTVLHAASNCDYSGLKSISTERILSHFSAGVIAVSELGAADYKKKFSWQKNIRVIKNGVNFRDAKKTAKAREGKRKSNIILQVGRVVPVKGQHISIQAMPDVIKSHPEARLKLAGLIEDKEYQKHLEKLIAELDIKEHVEFLGPRSDIFDLLAQADVYVMPSSAEAHSVAMLEALASGIPVITSDIPTLAQFSEMEGVRCIPRENSSAWSENITSALNAPNIFIRDTSNFDIKNTAIEYLRMMEV